MDGIVSNKPKVSINKGAIADLMREVQKEFDKHPITARIDGAVSGGNVTNYHGPVYVTAGGHAQVAFGSASLVNRDETRPVAQGYEDLAERITTLLTEISDYMSEDDAREAREFGSELLSEVTTEEPNTAKVSRLIAALKGALAAVAVGAANGLGSEAATWATEAIRALST